VLFKIQEHTRDPFLSAACSQNLTAFKFVYCINDLGLNPNLGVVHARSDVTADESLLTCIVPGCTNNKLTFPERKYFTLPTSKDK
jgi:hypothetical protein